MIIREHNTLDGIVSVAAFSPCEKYRYFLSRQWNFGDLPRHMTFIMLNPSTATEEVNDPTIERCQRRAMMGGYRGISILNLFAYRATAPEDMKAAPDPIGPENDRYLRETLEAAQNGFNTVVCGWGTHGAFKGRDKQVAAIFKEYDLKPLALKVTKDGHPSHPLYIPYSAQPQPFEIQA